MARLEWVILTERTIIEAQSGVVSLMSLVENINVEQPPGQPPPGVKVAVPFRFYVNQQWARSYADRGERIEGRLTLHGPNKKPYLVVPFEVDLEKSQRTRLITGLVGFPALGQGEYPAVVQVRKGKRWQTVGKTQFMVTIKDGPTPPVATRH
jgi:hypothetical protein